MKPSFLVRAEKIESEKFDGTGDLSVIEFAIRRSHFRIQKLTRLIDLARKSSDLRVAVKKKKTWIKRLERVKKNLNRFEKLKAMQAGNGHVDMHRQG